MNQTELFPSMVAPAYRKALAKAIKALPADRKGKASCRAALAADDLDGLRAAFSRFGVSFPLEEPELGEFATHPWTLQQRLSALAAFTSLFSDPSFESGVWRGSLVDRDQMPWFDLDDKVTEFLKTLYDYGWVQDFDWIQWMRTEEAQRLANDPAALEVATTVQLAKVLTVSARRDRFSEGSFAADFKSGLIARIVKRATALLNQMEAASDGSL